MTGRTATIRDVLQARGFSYPEDWIPDNVGACRSCRAEILWCITPAGRRAPVNRDGTSHFSSCPAADQWRKKR